MKLIEKNTFGDDTFYILEMDAQDKEAISEHVGNVNGSYIMYNGLSAINDSTLAYPRIGHLWAEIKLEDTYQTIRECRLAIKARVYQRAYTQANYLTTLMLDNINRVKKFEVALEEFSNKLETSMESKSTKSRTLMALHCVKQRSFNGQKFTNFGSNVGDIVYIDPMTITIDSEGSVYAESFNKETLERIGVIDLARFTNM